MRLMVGLLALAWSRATDGLVTGSPEYAPLKTEADFSKWKGKLRGRIVLVEPMRDLLMQPAVLGRRWTEAELTELRSADSPAPAPNRIRRAPPRSCGSGRAQLRSFLIEEGVQVAITIGRGDGGTVFGQYASTREVKDSVAVPAMVLAAEHESVNVAAEIPGGDGLLLVGLEADTAFGRRCGQLKQFFDGLEDHADLFIVLSELAFERVNAL